MDLKFKIIYGFDSEREITIELDELEKSYGLFMLGGRALFKSGDAVDSKYILAIKPDPRATMGWNVGYKLGVEDYAEISAKGIDRELQIAQAKIKERVDYLIANGKQNLIGKNVEIPELEKGEIREGKLKSIGEIVDNKENLTPPTR